MIVSKPLIEIRNVSFQYPGSETKVLNDASLQVEEGDFWRLSVGMDQESQPFVKQ